MNLLQEIDVLPVAPAPAGTSTDILRLLPVAVYMTDADGRITFFNEAAAELWGWEPPPGAVWCGSFRLYRPDGTPLPHAECPMAITLRSKSEVRGGEAVLERADGTRIPFRAYPRLLLDADGEVSGAVNMMVDISSREREVEAQHHLAAIVESSDDAIVSKDLSGTIRSWNAGAERLFGYTAAEAVGRSITMLIPEERLDEEPRIIGQITRGERIDHYETVRLRKDGSSVHVSLTVSPMKDSSGRVVGASKIARDIGAQKEAQSRILTLMREVNHRVKNQYAVILSVIRETGKRTVDPLVFEAQVRDRIMALARSHDLLVLGNWRGATIFELLLAQLEPFSVEDSLVMSGPSLALQPNAVQYLGMAFHELATNSVKHGAMSVSAGTVNVSWKIGRTADGQRRFSLTWSETGGPAPKADGGKGFGSTVLKRVAPMAVDGTAELDFSPEGLSWTLEAPMAQIEAGN